MSASVWQVCVRIQTQTAGLTAWGLDKALYGPAGTIGTAAADVYDLGAAVLLAWVVEPLRLAAAAAWRLYGAPLLGAAVFWARRTAAAAQVGYVWLNQVAYISPLCLYKCMYMFVASIHALIT